MRRHGNRRASRSAATVGQDPAAPQRRVACGYRAGQHQINQSGREEDREEIECRRRELGAAQRQFLTAMTEASDEFFSALTASLPSAGTMVRIACGAMIAAHQHAAASCRALGRQAICPGSTPMTPARRISAMNGASLADKSQSRGSHRSSAQCRYAARRHRRTPLQDQRRAAEDYGVGASEAASSRKRLSCMLASARPTSSPPISPRHVTSSVSSMPSSRYGRLR